MILFSEIGTIGEVLVIHNISRHCGGVYECMAFNGVEPAISKTVKVDVQCKYMRAGHF